MTKCIAIIPARGGSKRIPRKNIKSFLGSPIIKYSIDAALQAGCFDEVMVSTDSVEIGEIAKSYGANVPFLRSEKNSDDHAVTADVIQEVLSNYKKNGKEFDFFCCIYPTAPFITSQKILEAYTKLTTGEADSILSVVAFSFPILRSLKIENSQVTMNWPEHINTRSQDLPEAYHDAGQFYFLKTIAFLRENKLYTEKMSALILPESEVQDIDNLEDWKIAEIKYTFLLEKLKESNV